MAMLPHQFEKLTSREEKAVLMVGAGLSYGIVPMAAGLLPNAQKAAEAYSIPHQEFSTIDTKSEDGKRSAIYYYSDVIFKTHNDKLDYAQRLGILDDPRWYAKVGLPLRGSTPRHRVIARLARENLLYEIWSYNWDTILESAFDAVGFTRGRQDEIKQPWNTLFDSMVTSDDLFATPTDGFFKIYKPHGCLFAMREAQSLSVNDHEKSKQIADRFLIGQNELSLDKRWTEEEPGQTFLSRMHTSLNHHVLIVGWSLPEKYVHSKLSYIMQSIQAQREHLTIIDPFYQHGHEVISRRYNLNQSDTHAEVSPSRADLSTDDLFLAIQAKYSLKQLLANTDEDSTEQKCIQEKLNQCDLDHAKKSLLDWTDNFLPAWIRLCWRTEYLKVRNFNAQDIRLEKPDVHIPYQGIEGTARIDMEMAASIFYHIQKSGVDWDYVTFPGGLWDCQSGRLILPLPNASFGALQVVKPLIKTIEEKMAYVSCMVIMPVSHSALSGTTTNRLKDALKHMATKPQLMRDEIWKYTENLIDYKDIS